jgi:hypothetical protein
MFSLKAGFLLFILKISLSKVMCHLIVWYNKHMRTVKIEWRGKVLAKQAKMIFTIEIPYCFYHNYLNQGGVLPAEERYFLTLTSLGFCRS